MLKISRVSNYDEFKIYSERWQDILYIKSHARLYDAWMKTKRVFKWN